MLQEKEYTELEVEVIRFEAVDVIRTSVDNTNTPPIPVTNGASFF